MGSKTDGSRRKWTPWLAVVLWMTVIFLFSAQEAADSSRLSGGILQGILSMFSWLPFIGDMDLELAHLLIRKGAHFSIYAVLGVLTARALVKNGVSGARAWLLALLICVFYAASDEVHQLFIPGRSGQATDVALDGSGSLIGILLFQAVRLGKQ